MPHVAPDYTKVKELNMLEYESGKRLELGILGRNEGNGKGTLIS